MASAVTAPDYNSELMLDGNGNLYNPNVSSSLSFTDSNAQQWLDWLQRKASNGDPDAIDKLLTYYMSERSLKSAQDWTAEREDTQYQRLVEDLKKAGINPNVLFMGGSASPVSSTSGGRTYSSTGIGQSARNRDNNANDLVQKLIGLAGTTLAVMAMLAA